jgi:CheY-like chemotaxis protein
VTEQQSSRLGFRHEVTERFGVLPNFFCSADAAPGLVEDPRVSTQCYQPEAILLDIGMRGLDGYETCRRIRRVLGNRVLLVALTGFGQERDKEKATHAGFDAHLTKPADGAALAGILAMVRGS